MTLLNPARQGGRKHISPLNKDQVEYLMMLMQEDLADQFGPDFGHVMRSLQRRGYAKLCYQGHRDYWTITPAGRAAISSPPLQPDVVGGTPVFASKER